MKRSRRVIALLMGSVLAALFIVCSVWGVYPLSGHTLPQLLSRYWNVSFKTSACIVSIWISILGAGALAVWSFRGESRTENLHRSDPEASHDL